MKSTSLHFAIFLFILLIFAWISAVATNTENHKLVKSTSLLKGTKFGAKEANAAFVYLISEDGSIR